MDVKYHMVKHEASHDAKERYLIEAPEVDHRIFNFLKTNVR